MSLLAKLKASLQIRVSVQMFFFFPIRELKFNKNNSAVPVGHVLEHCYWKGFQGHPRAL